jgi:hypothetical protein
MSNYEETIRKATRLGINDATHGFERNSRSLTGSMWDKYYNRGYDQVANKNK